jgi:branched-chain amino acid aminotransferase
MFINLNGQLLPGDKPSLKHINRAFRYGDGLFESLRVFHGKILFLQDHLNRVLEGAVMLGMIPMGGRNQAYSMLENEIKRLLQHGTPKLHCRMRLTIFRNDGGLYEPDSTGFGFLIETSPVEQNSYTFNSRGLEIDTFNEVHKTTDRISNYKTCNSLIYVMASLYKKSKKLDDCIILNIHERPLEFTSSNLFLLKDGTIYTPPLSEGCISGVMRRNLLEFLQKEGYVISVKALDIEALKNAEEIFRCNMGQGIQWIGKFRDTTYSGKETQELFSRFQLHLDSLLYFAF